jgi:hypothetical protein
MGGGPDSQTGPWLRLMSALSHRDIDRLILSFAKCNGEGGDDQEDRCSASAGVVESTSTRTASRSGLRARLCIHNRDTQISGVDVRLSPSSSAKADMLMGPSWVHFRTHTVQQNSPYSITSSARASSWSGTVSPSALAVLRLMMSLYLVGNWTGNSLTLAPRKRRST